MRDGQLSKIASLAALAGGLLIMPAGAQTPPSEPDLHDEFEACADIEDDAERLACFDAAAKAFEESGEADSRADPGSAGQPRSDQSGDGPRSADPAVEPGEQGPSRKESDRPSPRDS